MISFLGGKLVGSLNRTTVVENRPIFIAIVAFDRSTHHPYIVILFCRLHKFAVISWKFEVMFDTLRKDILWSDPFHVVSCKDTSSTSIRSAQ